MMNQMTSPADFADMDDRTLREWIREARMEYRSEKSRRHMSNPATLDLVKRQHDAAMEALRARL